MTNYIRTELGLDGIAKLRGSFEKVKDRAAASEFSHSDAQYFETQAAARFPDLVWETEEVGNGKYLVKTGGPKKRRGRK